MVHRNLPILLAIGGSIAVHSIFFATAPEYHLNPLDIKPSAPARRETRVTVVFVDPKDVPAPDKAPPDKAKAPEKPEKPEKPDKAEKPDPATPPPPERVAAPAPPALPKPPPPKPKPQVEDFPNDMGEFTGKGIGANAAEGLQPLQSREGDQDQGFLSRDPRGHGMVGDPPTPFTLPPGDGGSGGVPGRAGIASQSPAVAPPPVSPSRSPDFAQSPAAPEPAATQVPLPGPTALERTASARRLPVIAAGPPPMKARPAKGEPDHTAPSEADESDQRIAEHDGKTKTDQPPAKAVQIAMATPPVRSIDIGTVGVAHAPPPPVHPQSAVPPPPPPPARVPLSPAFAAAPIAQVEELTLTPAPPAPPTPPTTTPPPVPAVAPPPPAPAAAPAVAATGDGRAPGQRHPSADPAQQSDSESDPFSKVASYNLRDGKLDPRFGRKVKTVRPKIPIVGQVDAFAMVGANVTLKVSIDATGKVTTVSIAKSSGSNEIDQPCLIAMYDWWFEPLKDKQGNPLPDVVMFSIGFR